MPELPEVESVRRALAPLVTEQRVATVRFYRTNLRTPLPATLPQAARGRTFATPERRGKYLLLPFWDGGGIGLHLGMSGRIRWFPSAPPPREPHDHIEIYSAQGACLRFTDPRRFGQLFAWRGAVRTHPTIAKLGPEPWMGAKALQHQFGARARPIKTALMDQALVAGLGNIYANEIVHRAGLAPWRPCAALTPEDFDALAAAMAATLEDAIAAGGSSINDHRLVDGSLGYFHAQFCAYGREGEACLRPGCGGEITRSILAGRSTYACTHCAK